MHHSVGQHSPKKMKPARVWGIVERTPSQLLHAIVTGCVRAPLAPIVNDDTDQTIHLKMCGNLFTSILFLFRFFISLNKTNKKKKIKCSLSIELRFDIFHAIELIARIYKMRLSLWARSATVQWHRANRFQYSVCARHASERQTTKVEEQKRKINNKIETILFTARRNHDKCTCECSDSLWNVYCLESCRFADNLVRAHTHWRPQ